MNNEILLVPIFLPLLAGVLVLLCRGSARWLREPVAVLAALGTLVAAWALFQARIAGASFTAPWAGEWAGVKWDFALKLLPLNGFILLAASGFGLLVALYSWRFMEKREHANQFFAYLLFSLGMANGATLANHLIVLLFCWEGLLGVLFGMIAIGGKDAFKTATKMFIIVGITDLCMMFGIILTGWLAGDELARRIAQASQAHDSAALATLAAMNPMHISDIAILHPSTATLMGGMALVFLMIGAISKAGSMPFHTWIPDAAIDAPLPFMALMPASLEKLLGIYFLTRITMEMYAIQEGGWASWMFMIIGAVTIVLPVMMALVQKDYKRLLSYHAISQVGYMVLGVGTASVIGIVGGVFHMINHAMYKSTLFLTGGAVERQTGTTDLAKLGGLATKMPVTFFCFFIAALSISGFPGTNGFWSKELVYAAALKQNVVFYLAAIIGTLFTGASFLKLGHAAFFGPRRAEHEGVKEAPLTMLIPMAVIAGGCLVFGLWRALPLDNLVQPGLGLPTGEGGFAHEPINPFLLTMTIVALGGALVNHLFGAKVAGSGLHALDHVRNAPVLAPIYDRAEKRWFDPYNWGLNTAYMFARLAWRLDRAIDWLYDGLAVAVTFFLSARVRRAHTGNYAMYIVWSLVGAGAVIVVMMYG